jgi:hypothetical protein
MFFVLMEGPALSGIAARVDRPFIAILFITKYHFYFVVDAWIYNLLRGALKGGNAKRQLLPITLGLANRRH